MRFELKAIGPGGEVEALDFQAADEMSAVRHIEGRGYTVLSVRQRRGLRLPWQRGAERFPVALFSQELRVLIVAGLPLVEAIETLAEKERRNDFRAIEKGERTLEDSSLNATASLKSFHCRRLTPPEV